jgi:hypothetical protein
LTTINDIELERSAAMSVSNNKGLVDQLGKQGSADDTFPAHETPGPWRWVEVLMHRWPTALGVAVAALTFFNEQVTVEFVSSVSAIVVLLGVIYVGAAVLERRRAAWVMLLPGFVVLTAGRLLDWRVGASVVFLVSALIFLVLGVVRGQLRKGGGLPLQTIAMLGFAAIGLLALSVSPALGGYLVAAALIGHAIWDAVYFWLNRVVVRSYAEFCGVLDLVLGVAILLMM